MKSISTLEDQIARELKELDRIQGVLHSIQNNQRPSVVEKENWEPQLEDVVIRKPTFKTEVKQRTSINGDPLSDIKKPLTLRREGSLVLKELPKNRPQNADPPQESLREFLELEREHNVHPVSELFVKSSSKQLKVASGKPPKLSKEQKFTRPPLGKKSVPRKYGNSERSSVQAEDDIEDLEGLAELVIGSRGSRAEKSVLDIGHEQFEKMCHKFREARMNTKSFDERVKLMVLEVGLSFKQEREQRVYARGHQTS